MSALVVDASAALSWCFEDEASAQWDIQFEHVWDNGAVVPQFWHLELANILLQAERRGRITAGDLATRLELIGGLPITTDGETTVRAWRETPMPARTERLTTCDAAYLELAIRRGVPLLTKDEALAAAAKRLGVRVPI